jgi:hypothetical protein
MLYKYLGPNRLSVIDDFMIRFTQPAALNDPFESALLVDATPYDESALLIEAMREEIIKDLNPSTDEEWKQLEDAVLEVHRHAQSQLKPGIVGRGVAELINRAQGVLSLSRANDSLLMWAHYGDSHQGYVIGLDETHPFFRAPDRFGNVTKPHNVIYTSRRMPVLAGSEDFYEQLLCYKSLEWAYEQEVRIFRTFGNPDDFAKNKSDQVHLFSLPRECIKEIYIGANASAETRKKVLHIVDRRKLQVRVFDAYIAEDRYALDFGEIGGPLHSYRPHDTIGRCEKKTTMQQDLSFAYNGMPTPRSFSYDAKLSILGA